MPGRRRVTDRQRYLNSRGIVTRGVGKNVIYRKRVLKDVFAKTVGGFIEKLSAFPKESSVYPGDTIGVVSYRDLTDKEKEVLEQNLKRIKDKEEKTKEEIKKRRENKKKKEMELYLKLHDKYGKGEIDK